jgi:hypothetical protein
MAAGYYSFGGVNSSIWFLVSLKNDCKTEYPEFQRAFFSNLGQVHGLVISAFCNDRRRYCLGLVDSTAIHVKVSILDPPLFLGSCTNCFLFALEIYAAG